MKYAPGDIAAALAGPRLGLPLFGRTDSAVLVPLVETGGELHVLFTRRSGDLPHHAGEISFPGGVVEPGDASSYAAALREAAEEAGIPGSDCRFLGTLDDGFTGTGFRITPHVACLPRLPELALHAGEVEHALLVPLRFFVENGSGYDVYFDFRGARHRSPVYTWRGNIIWGATARVLRELVRRLSPGPVGAGSQAAALHAGLREIAMRLFAARKVVLTTHENPDPDGLGAEVAAEELLLALGKDVVIANHHGVPPRFGFLTFRSPFFHGEAVVPELADGADLVFVLDTAERQRTGRASALIERMGDRIVGMDHHLDGELESPCFVRDPRCSSVSEIMHLFLSRVGFPYTPRAVNALYAGIVFDTHSFRFLNGRADALSAAAQLLELGADASGIQDALFARVSPGHARVLGLGINRAQREFAGRFMWSWITLEEMRSLAAISEDAGDVSAFFATLDGVDVGLFLRETRPGVWKLSFRSRRDFPINDICKMLGGGGHANAGGATVAGRPEQIVSDIRERVAAVLATGPESR